MIIELDANLSPKDLFRVRVALSLSFLFFEALRCHWLIWWTRETRCIKKWYMYMSNILNCRKFLRLREIFETCDQHNITMDNNITSLDQLVNIGLAQARPSYFVFDLYGTDSARFLTGIVNEAHSTWSASSCCSQETVQQCWEWRVWGTRGGRRFWTAPTATLRLALWYWMEYLIYDSHLHMYRSYVSSIV